MTPSLQDVWVWMNAGCNANEIAAYGKVSEDVARAWMVAARFQFMRSHVH